jgi:hypothetical protein
LLKVVAYGHKKFYNIGHRRSWENLHFLDADLPTEDYTGEMAWADFRGQWGNMKELVRLT